MKQEMIPIIQKSFEKIIPVATTTAEYFYKKLFEFDPEMKTLFPAHNQEKMSQQGDKFMRMLSSAVASLQNFENIKPILIDLGKRHKDYNVKNTHYDVVGTALIASLAKGLQEDFTLEVELAWSSFYNTLAHTMKSAI